MAKKQTSLDHVRILFVVVILALGLSLFIFYQDNTQKSDFIGKQTAIIQGLNGIVSDQNGKISRLTDKVIGLEGNVSFLISDVSKKAQQILALNTQLGQTEVKLEVAKTEIEELTPTIKNYFAVGVKNSGEGVVIPMGVKIAKGTGILSVNIKGVDLQSGATASIRTASQVASKISGVDISKKDVTVSFVNEGDLVVLDGPSAGGAITVTMIAALENKNMDTDSMMTGTIETGGSIGKVGGVSAKATAAKKNGASKFYVPKGENVFIDGLNVVELDDIQDAMTLILR